ncbi:uncharacterized protein Z518_00438 [Rhinocladiella mackenziei CBS 650.93]|uniref:Uncharacterized protein n=1 Tax=Rhinocladiella mackenziei CBS 650.93 TaxID=1442369 RepID=A0A0D2ITG1_9EURO|nr:uncharacterized protein Z518_00438 [Rhinocladiella mackenziei CBS 650.93]KIX09359.1 hypothetical protein Z518_00438 [Rhinocladiella mackenziei CBS 650.93]
MDAIPLSIVHPRWWLKLRNSNESFIAPRDWRPTYASRTLLFSPKKADVYSDMTKVLKLRETLPTDEKNRFTRQIQGMLENLQEIGSRQAALAALPIDQPDPIPKRSYKRKRPQAEESRGLTALEMATQAQRQQDRHERQQARDASIVQERAEATELPPFAQPSRDESPPTPSPSPTSTAPPQLHRASEDVGIRPTNQEDRSQERCAVRRLFT